MDEIDKEKEGNNVKEEEELRLQDLTKTKKKAASNAKNAPLIAKKASATAKPSPKPVSAKVVKPKVPMPNPRNASAGLQTNGKGAVSPAAASSSSSGAGRAHSPTPIAGARSVSPPAATSGRASSPGAQAGSDKKRRKIEGASGETSDDGAVKKQNQASGSGTVPAGDGTVWLVVILFCSHELLFRGKTSYCFMFLRYSRFYADHRVRGGVVAEEPTSDDDTRSHQRFEAQASKGATQQEYPCPDCEEGSLVARRHPQLEGGFLNVLLTPVLAPIYPLKRRLFAIKMNQDATKAFSLDPLPSSSLFLPRFDRLDGPHQQPAGDAARARPEVPPHYLSLPRTC